MKEGSKNEPQESRMRDYMSKNKMYFMIHSNIHRIKTRDIITPQRRVSSKVAAKFVTPTTYELREEEETDNRSKE